MKQGTCADCGEKHDPRERCGPGRARATSILFPSWVSISQCELQRRSRSFGSRHGRVRFETYEVTDHGRRMAALRPDEVARPSAAEPVHRSTHWGRTLSS
jgi:hypothetical protein